MPQFLADLIRQLHPSGERLQIMNRFQRRALMPTWPVTVTLAILGGALLLAGQGQAIVRYTSSEFGFDWNSAGTWFFLTLHSVIMMYTAFVLSAVTRRSYLDTSAKKAASGMSDPVDPSIKLRLVYSYLCGVFLPLLLMAMALWYRYGWDNWRVWTGLAIGIIAACVYLKLAQMTYPPVSRALGRLYAEAPQTRGWTDEFSRPFLRVVRFATQPTHRIAQSAIVILIFMMVTLTIFQVISSETDRLSTGLHFGAWAFFLSFLFIHTFFRLFTERFVKLHHGHTARYIIIDRNLSWWFGWLRFAWIVLIPVSFWVHEFVVWLGPLNVGLFGTLWITLVLSYFVETGAQRWRIPKANPPRMETTAASEKDSPSAKDAAVYSKNGSPPRTKKKMRQRRTPVLTFRSWFFLFLLGLLALEWMLGVTELIRYRYQGDLILAVIAVIVIVGLAILAFQLSRPAFKSRSDVVTRLNSIPTLLLLSPILLLGLGEAHHVHRISVEGPWDGDSAQPTSLGTGAQASDVTDDELFPIRALRMKSHAERWLAERKNAIGSQAEKAEPYPAIVVLAEGGGIRAAAHAGYYLSALDEALRLHCDPKNAGEAVAGTPPADDPLCWRGRDTKLIDNIYLISGVSGGAIGTATYIAALYEENEAADEERQETGEAQPAAVCSHGPGATPCLRDQLIGETLSADHLSSLLSGMFASDVLTTIVPVQFPNRLRALISRRPDPETDGVRVYPTDFVTVFEEDRGMPDRADIFETRLARVFEDARIKAIGGPRRKVSTFDLPLEVVARQASQTGRRQEGPGPIVFFSTFSETLGIQMATANVDILRESSSETQPEGGRSKDEKDPGASAEVDVCGAVPIVQQIIDKGERLPPNSSFDCSRRTRTLSLSTAAHMSARFPISNPTGVIETRDQRGRWRRHFFVDGGYMDNSGAFAASQAVEALIKAAEAQDDGPGVNVIVVHLYAMSIPPRNTFSPMKSVGSAANRQSEFASIPSAVLKARSAASRAPVMLLCDQIFDFDGADSDLCDKVLGIRIPQPDPYGLIREEDRDSKTGEGACNPENGCMFTEQFRLKEFDCWRTLEGELAGFNGKEPDPDQKRRMSRLTFGGHPTDPGAFTSIAAARPADEASASDEAAKADDGPIDDDVENGEFIQADIEAEAEAEHADQSAPAPGRGLVAASWMPMPLEVATNSRQDNAMAALLGWTLPKQMDATIRWVARGAGELTIAELISVTGGEGGPKMVHDPLPVSEDERVCPANRLLGRASARP